MASRLKIISHAVWLYFCFPLSLRMVDELLAARGIFVSHETVRQWRAADEAVQVAWPGTTLRSAHDGINNLVLLRRHQVSATQHRAARTRAFQVWAEVAGVAAAA